jgi:16S rRNA (cytidine1402-2'-O)-methyltransferase
MVGKEPGQLYVVATPIGNLGDASPRLRETLAGVDLILAEDTRHARKLLTHLGVATAVQSYHQHNESRMLKTILKRLAAGANVALITDAGTPLISDPGFSLVRAARAAGFKLISIPGPCAAIAALAVAGLSCDTFLFVGFLPARAAARQLRLKQLRDEPHTLIFYESPHRIMAMLSDLIEIFSPDRPARLAKELTKLHEQIIGETLEDIRAWLQSSQQHRRGEFVVLVEGAAETINDADLERTLGVLLDYLPVARAVRAAQQLTGARRNELYTLASAIARTRRDSNVSTA